MPVVPPGNDVLTGSASSDLLLGAERDLLRVPTAEPFTYAFADRTVLQEWLFA